MKWFVAPALLCACGRVDFTRVDDAASAPTRFTIDSFSTASADYVAIPGASLTLPPSPGMKWLLLTNAYLGSTTPTGVTVEARYVVDGVVRGLGGTENSTANEPGPWQHFYVTDADVEHTIRYELHDAKGGTATISRLSVVAMALPAEAIVYQASDDLLPVVTSTASLSVDLELGALDGDYVGMLLVNASETPNQSNVHAEWRDERGTVLMPEIQHPREPFQSFLVLQRTTFVARPDVQMQLFTRTEGAQASIAYVRAVAVRADAFADVQFAEVTALQTSTLATVQPAVALSLAPATAREYIVLTSSRLQETCAAGPDAERHVEVDIDGVVEQATHATDNCTYTATYGSLRALASQPADVRVGWSTLNGTEVEYGASQILALGLR